MIYNPAKWYWSVAGNAAEVYSSASASYVPLTDSTYVSWLAAGGVPTPISADDIIMNQISVLEGNVTARMIQEAISNSSIVFPSNSPYAGQTSLQAITAIRTQIAALRAQLT